MDDRSWGLMYITFDGFHSATAYTKIFCAWKIAMFIHQAPLYFSAVLFMAKILTNSDPSVHNGTDNLKS